MTGEPLVIIGIGQDGVAHLGPEAQAHLSGAQILAGGKRHLAFFPAFAGTKIVLDGPTSDWMFKLKARDRQQRTVVLATGDPLYYGIGRLLLETFPKDELIFLPQVSSVALAFARLKETWNDACVVSLHGRPMAMLVPALNRREAKIAILTDGDNHPTAIARILCEKGLDKHYVLWVCENLGSDHERITRWLPADLKREDFAALNVVVLLAKAGAAAERSDELPLLGLPETAFHHRGDLITKREVRVQALCELELHAGDVLWDVGAGSGSVALEAARLSAAVTVFAIEKEADALTNLRQNLDHFCLGNVQFCAGEAPECFVNLPDPNAVFLGGNGGRLVAILEQVMRRLKPGGRLVLSCVTLETLSQAWNWFDERGLEPHVTSLQVAHSRPLGSLHCLDPEKPIFLLKVKKP